MENKSISFTLFTESIISGLKEMLGGGYTVLSHTVKKNNGMELTGVVARKAGCNVSPTVYINELYHGNMSGSGVKEAAGKVYAAIKEAEIMEDVDLSDFTDYGKAERRVAVKLVNAARNEELLVRVPHMLFHDLALVVYYQVREFPFDGNANILVNHGHREAWKVGTDELIKAAIENTPRLFPGRIESMKSIMTKFLSGEFGESVFEGEDGFAGLDMPAHLGDKNGCAMYVLSNEQKLYGAVCMLYPDILKRFSKKIGQDFYILPSSVHEVILVPASAIADESELREIVTDINRIGVAEDEVLADSVYYYSRVNDKIIMV